MTNTTELPRSPRTLRLIRRALFGVFAAGFLAAIAFALWPAPLAVDIERVRRGDVVVTVDEIGVTRVKDRYVVSAPLAGSLARIELHPGDPVTEGTIVARVLPSPSPLVDARARAEFEARVASTTAGVRQAEAAAERARSAVDAAEREVERTRAMVGAGAAPALALERLEAEARTRRAERASAEFGIRIARYERTMADAARGNVGTVAGDAPFEVRSPVAGRVLRILHPSDGPIAAGTPLLEIGDPQALEVVVDVLTRDAVRIATGQRATLTRWGGEGALDARVRLVEPSAFTRVSALGVDEQRVNVILDILSPHATWSALGDGYRVEASIEVATARGTLVIPELTTFRVGADTFVFAVEDGIARRRTIAVGLRNGIDVELRGGARLGSALVLHPSDQVHEGVAVRARR